MTTGLGVGSAQQLCGSVADRLAQVLKSIGSAIVACSGGVDSLLLATVFHRFAPREVIVAHAIGPAVPGMATKRVKDWARLEGWALTVIDSGEFADPVYRANPVDRCYYCKSHLYTALSSIADAHPCVGESAPAIVSGANIDDLGEYRPGLGAAREFRVRHPFVEAGLTKQHIRELARDLNLPFAELPASPCLASRLYTGTAVTRARLAAVEFGEEFLKQQTGISVVRCRIKDHDMRIEVSTEERKKILPAILDRLRDEMREVSPAVREIYLDPLPYQPGRAFVLQQ